MANSPNQSPPGKQFELRLTANDLEFDRLLAELTLPATRARLPGFLHLFSERTFIHTVTDRDIDGHSQTETALRAFRMKVTNHTRTKFSLDDVVTKERVNSGEQKTRINLGLRLGIQATSELVLPPFFDAEDRKKETIPFYYTIPDPVRTRTMGVAFRQLEQYLAEHPRGIVDELTLVELATRNRSLRTRVRPENATVKPIQLTQPSSEVPGTILSDVG
ncbi:MAG: hypothetical protein WAV04_03860 [Candidatus Microsaccharimonas sp.]